MSSASRTRTPPMPRRCAASSPTEIPHGPTERGKSERSIRIFHGKRAQRGGGGKPPGAVRIFHGTRVRSVPRRVQHWSRRREPRPGGRGANGLPVPLRPETGLLAAVHVDRDGGGAGLGSAGGRADPVWVDR